VQPSGMESSPHPLVDLTANCACGAVHLHVVGAIRSMLLCSCEDCQKASGTGHSTVALVGADDVAVTGKTKSFSRPANSGAILTRYFCPQCGTPLYGQSSRAPGIRMLAVGFFGKDTDWFKPNQLIFHCSHRAWDELAVSLPRHETYRDEAAQ